MGKKAIKRGCNHIPEEGNPTWNTAKQFPGSAL
jgi:hypothetical protein